MIIFETVLLLMIVPVCYFYRNFLEKNKIFDTPGNLKQHKIPTPKGIGFIFSIFIFCILLYYSIYLDNEFSPYNRFWIIPLSVLCLSLISLLDDIIGINQFVRLFLQINFVIFSFSGLNFDPFSIYHHLFSISIPPKVMVVIILYCWVFIINLSNFIDGADANFGIFFMVNSINLLILELFNNQSILFINLFILMFFISILAIFFSKNIKLKFFLGDSGSIPLGFMIGWLFIQYSFMGYFLEILFINIIYFFDIITTLLLKIFKRENIFIRHQDFYFIKRLTRVGVNRLNIEHALIGIIGLILIILNQFELINDIFYIPFGLISLFYVFREKL